jgi:hypothetical protein
VSVQAGIDERIRELVGQHRADLAELVRQAVDRELPALVEAELEQRTNGHATPAPVVATKVCNGNGRDLPVDRFEKYRSRCRDCRRQEEAARARKRRAAETAEAEPPRPDDQP